MLCEECGKSHCFHKLNSKQRIAMFARLTDKKNKVKKKQTEMIITYIGDIDENFVHIPENISILNDNNL
jgi:hypothetical protein